MNNDFPDDGGPHSSRCTGLSGFMAISMTLHPQNQQYHQIILVYQGQADCFRGTVTEIVDGDTLDINNVRVRLALVNTPGRLENGYTEAIDFVQSVCGLGTTALVDEDDGQKEGSFDRAIGLVYCGGVISMTKSH